MNTSAKYFTFLLAILMMSVGTRSVSGFQNTETQTDENMTEAENAVASKPPQKPTSAKKWVSELQRVGREHRKGKTSAATDLVRAKLIKKIAETMDGNSIKFRTKVREVRWKKGIASVFTEATFDAKKTKRNPIILSRTLPFEIMMTQAEAAAIVPGQRFEFRGKLKFHPGKWGSVGPSTNSQQLYTIRHESIGSLFLGTFTTTDYECTIDRIAVKPRWASDQGKEDE